jgi:hypothetical protein
MRRSLLVGLIVLAAALAGGASGGTPVAITDPVWSGYAAFGQTFTDVKGSWTQPAATCSGLRQNTKTLAAIWVGLDGYSSNTVEQAGTEVDCTGSTPSYIAWYAFIPKTYVKLDPTSFPVAAGDKFTVEVSQNGSTATISLSSSAWASPFVVSAPVGSDTFSSAEWIVESLSQKLTNFGTVDFTKAAATGGGVTGGAIDDPAWNTSVLTMVSGNGRNAVDKDAISPLSHSGTSFSVTWLHI